MQTSKNQKALAERYPEEVCTFAGFTYPRYISTLPDIKKRKRSSGYFGFCRPVSAQKEGWGIYLEEDGAADLRWEWCDEIAASIRHKGWYTDSDGTGDTIRGIVFRLPKGRGFLAGWSIGVGMATTIEAGIWQDRLGAAHRANDIACIAAEQEREREEERREVEEDIVRVEAEIEYAEEDLSDARRQIDLITSDPSALIAELAASVGLLSEKIADAKSSLKELNEKLDNM